MQTLDRLVYYLTSCWSTWNDLQRLGGSHSEFDRVGSHTRYSPMRVPPVNCGLFFLLSNVFVFCFLPRFVSFRFVRPNACCAVNLSLPPRLNKSQTYPRCFQDRAYRYLNHGASHPRCYHSPHSTFPETRTLVTPIFVWFGEISWKLVDRPTLWVMPQQGFAARKKSSVSSLCFHHVGWCTYHKCRRFKRLPRSRPGAIALPGWVFQKRPSLEDGDLTQSTEPVNRHIYARSFQQYTIRCCETVGTVVVEMVAFEKRSRWHQYLGVLRYTSISHASHRLIHEITKPRFLLWCAFLGLLYVAYLDLAGTLPAPALELAVRTFSSTCRVVSAGTRVALFVSSFLVFRGNIAQSPYLAGYRAISHPGRILFVFPRSIFSTRATLLVTVDQRACLPICLSVGLSI